jgi:plastocyanin
MRHVRAVIVAAIVAILVVATASVALAATKSVGVKKSGSKYLFTASTLSIKKGDSVTWSWRGSVPHNVKGAGFQSATKPKLTFTRKFTKAGTFPVVCTLHQALGQKMTVKVS